MPMHGMPLCSWEGQKCSNEARARAENKSPHNTVHTDLNCRNKSLPEVDECQLWSKLCSHLSWLSLSCCQALRCHSCILAAWAMCISSDMGALLLGKSGLASLCLNLSVYTSQ